MHSPQELRELVEQELNTISLPENPANLYEPVRYMFGIGGKRIRPVLTLMAGEIFQKSPEQLIRIASAMELFHNFTLMHDDIMDNAALRRGKPTVHEKWNNNTAILSGDITFNVAYREIIDSNPENLKPILEVFNEIAFKVCEGQQWDMNFETNDHVSRQDYLNMIELKTAWLLGGSLKIGAICAGAPESEQEKLFNTGISMGMAFQLMDDILDTFGNEEKVGKNIGGDINANKKTILLVTAFDKASEDQKNNLRQIMEGNDPDKVSRVKQIFHELKVKEYAEKLMQDYYNHGINNINALEVEQEKKEPLKQLFQGLMGRES